MRKETGDGPLANGQQGKGQSFSFACGVLTTFVVTATTMLLPAPVKAQTCYQDDTGRIVKRRRPGYMEVPCPPEGAGPSSTTPSNASPGEAPTSVPDVRRPAPAESTPSWDSGRTPRRQTIQREQPVSISPIPRPGLKDYSESVPMPDRWRIVEAIGYEENLLDPYNRNVLKADRPIHDDWFFSVMVIGDTFYELREVTSPVGGVSTPMPGNIDIFGSSDQWSVVQNLATEFVYYKGDTVFKPPDYEFRFTPVLNYNYVELEVNQGVNADSRQGLTRDDFHVGIQAAFIDKHLRNVSDRFDFDSVRFGIQPFSSDFRGFLFQDNQLGARLFGTRDNNKWQYNIAAFRRLEKDTNSGLNDLGESLRDDDVFIANVYRQDFPVLGFTSQATVAYNRNREDDRVRRNNNNFIERPASFGNERLHQYDVGYVGYNGDGHFGRMNLTTALYYAFGERTPGTFSTTKTDISAYFAAAEFSFDFDWIRPRISMLYASGDDDPFDDQENGFDAIFENPQFAGADTSYWIRQTVPLVGGGRVAISSRNGVLNNLRTSKEEGQSNFTNPGTILAGVGVDMDILPTLRLSLNANSIYFADTAVLQVARNQGNIDEHVGYDVSTSLIWRPLMSQNIVVRSAYATLIPGDGFDQLFPDEDAGYFMLNAIFTY